MATISSNINPYVIPHIVNDPNPGQTAVNRGIDRAILQNKLVNVSKGGVAGGGTTSSKSKIKKK